MCLVYRYRVIAAKKTVTVYILTAYYFVYIGGVVCILYRVSFS